jgi:hypothetical protein
MRPGTEEVVRDACKTMYGADPRPVRPVDYTESKKIAARRDIDDEEGSF